MARTESASRLNYHREIPCYSPEQGYCPRVCIFDIDNTVTVGDERDERRCRALQPSPAWALNNIGSTCIVRQAVRKCYVSGYWIAFASAESKDEGLNLQQQKFIRSLEPARPWEDPVFGQSFFTSPAYQTSWSILYQSPETEKLEYGKKEAMMLNSLRYLRSSREWFLAH